MDQAIDSKVVRKRLWKRVAMGAAAVAVFVLVVAGLRSLLRPGIDLEAMRTAVVDRGAVEAVAAGGGTVVPANEQVLSCPFDTRLLQVLERPGARLDPGTPIVRLDDREMAARLEAISDQLALKQNQREQLTVSLKQQKDEIQGEMAILEKRVEYLAAKTEQQRELYEKDVTTIWAVRQAELDESIERIKLDQAKTRLQRLNEATRKQIEGLEIEMKLLSQQQAQVREDVARAEVRAGTTGVLTWVADEEGASLRQGDVVARVANLTHFRVEATLSDVHASRIAVGMKAEVVIGDSVLTGRVHSIPPAMAGGAMQVNITLDRPEAALLRANQRAEVYIVTERRDNVLRLRKGAYASGGGRTNVYVIHGDRAVRTSVLLGVAGRHDYEVLSGLQEGDRVVLADLSRFHDVDELRVR